MLDKLTLIIPCYNDTSRLARFLPILCEVLTAAPLPVVLAVVDDGSSKKEQASLEALIEKTRQQFSFVQPVIYQSCNQGKGAAILKGWDAYPDAGWHGFLDADGSVSAEEVLRMIHLLAEHSDKNTSLFASRIKMRGRKIKRSKVRHYSGRIFASMVGAFIDESIYDSQCGFKIIPQVAYQKIRAYLHEKRFAFDVELLAALNHFGFPVEEVPIDWSDVTRSKVALLRDTFKMVGALFSIRLRMRTWMKKNDFNELT